MDSCAPSHPWPRQWCALTCTHPAPGLLRNSPRVPPSCAPMCAAPVPWTPLWTWPYARPEQGEEIESIAAGTRALPFTDDFDFQFDLMVDDALMEAPRFAELGTASLVIHAS